MLKVTSVNSRAPWTIKVEGQLFTPWVPELQSVWKQAQQAALGKTIVVDLSGMTSIDSNGEAALMTMVRQGARLTARGVYNEHLAKELTREALEADAAHGTAEERKP
jgi:ABC-type transporter Mla MlaB component